MTVGGNTNGKATTAPMGPRYQERVRDSHRAIGVPMINRIRVVSAASLMVNQIAEKSALDRGIYSS